MECCIYIWNSLFYSKYTRFNSINKFSDNKKFQVKCPSRGEDSYKTCIEIKDENEHSISKRIRFNIKIPKTLKSSDNECKETYALETTCMRCLSRLLKVRNSDEIMNEIIKLNE